MDIFRLEDCVIYAERNISGAELVRKVLGATLTHDSKGKPLAEGYNISLADTDNVTVLAVSAYPVGADIERADRKPPAPLTDIGEWTDLEAFYKALGTGITSTECVRDRKRVQGTRRYKSLIEGYVVSVAVLRQ